jgi:hypothetical protein
MVAGDKFVQDYYFDWLYQKGRRDELLNYAGPVVVPESLEFYRGKVCLKRGRLIRASRHLAESFSLSLVKPCRELRKDKHVAVVLSKTDSSLLAHAILMILHMHAKRRALSVIDVPARAAVDALVFYKMKALVGLGMAPVARSVHREYLAAAPARSTRPQRTGMTGVLLRLSASWYRFALRRYAAKLG